MKKLGILILLVVSFSSCTVQERIVFDEGMGGRYTTSFDLSQLFAVASQGAPQSLDQPMKKLDTLVIFDDMLEQYKDSIATLPMEKQAELKKLKGMTMQMKMDQANSEFQFTAEKTFSNFNAIANVSEQMDEIFSMAKAQGVGAKVQGPGSEMLKTDKVVYTFEGNTFSRIDKKSLKETADDEPTEEDENATGDDMLTAMLGEFDDLLKQSVMTLSYTFPRKVASVSHKEAEISEDGKTVTYSIDWKSLMDEPSILENFSVQLEQE
ncbi:MAG: hypothetical protein R3359_12560 [Marinirhabdus sp.]|nr:hypothetical protein [Marinirhabdus sp.]